MSSCESIDFDHGVMPSDKLTLCESQQQQRWQTGEDGGQQQDPPATETVHCHTEKDAGQHSGQHAQKITEVEVRRVHVQVTCEAVLDPCANEADE